MGRMPAPQTNILRMTNSYLMWPFAPLYLVIDYIDILPFFFVYYFFVHFDLFFCSLWRAHGEAMPLDISLIQARSEGEGNG